MVLCAISSLWSLNRDYWECSEKDKADFTSNLVALVDGCVCGWVEVLGGWVGGWVRGGDLLSGPDYAIRS